MREVWGFLPHCFLRGALIIALCNMILPELYRSIRNMVYTVPEQLNEWMERLSEMEFDDSTLALITKNVLTETTAFFENWIRSDLLRQINIWISGLTEGVISVVNELMNIVIGIIVSVYVLFSKETFAGQSRKVVYAVLKPEKANLVLHITRKSNEIFGGFIIGKIIDSAIIGVLCFIGLSILDMPYTLLVSVIVGVTNVIPFFWAVHRCDPKCDTAFVDRSDQRTLLFGVHYLLAAVGWKYHRTKDSWRFYRTVCVLGSLFDFTWRRIVRICRHDYGSANICSDLLSVPNVYRPEFGEKAFADRLCCLR